jgi:hypothetical protein
VDPASQLNRARKTAMTLATVSIMCVLLTIYTWIQKSESERQARELAEELMHCKQEKK